MVLLDSAKDVVVCLVMVLVGVLELVQDTITGLFSMLSDSPSQFFVLLFLVFAQRIHHQVDARLLGLLFLCPVLLGHSEQKSKHALHVLLLTLGQLAGCLEGLLGLAAVATGFLDLRLHLFLVVLHLLESLHHFAIAAITLGLLVRDFFQLF